MTSWEAVSAHGLLIWYHNAALKRVTFQSSVDRGKLPVKMQLEMRCHATVRGWRSIALQFHVAWRVKVDLLKSFKRRTNSVDKAAFHSAIPHEGRGRDKSVCTLEKDFAGKRKHI